MSEEQINENYIRNKLSDICQDCIYLEKIIPIIREMLSERYVSGLRQGHFDNKMDLIQLQQEKQDFIKWLEEELGDRRNPRKDMWLMGVHDAYQEILDKVKESK